MKIIYLFIFFSSWLLPVFAQLTPFERSVNKNVTATYLEIKAYYEALDARHEQLKVVTYGLTDIGKPLQLVVLSKNKVFDPIQIRKQNKCILLINNGIHPGEPEGVDASMMLCRDLLDKKLLPDNVVICIIPVYNIDGCFNRGVSRANQNGPEAYGFRANATNLDLNLDFIKTDTRSSYAFQQLFNAWQPDVLIDNHNGNGADYTYVITMAETQRNKLNPLLAQFMTQKLAPELYDTMNKSGFEMVPLVKYEEKTPEAGIISPLETPRFCTGYAALHNTIGFMAETHKLKPFNKRVAASYQFIKNMILLIQKHAKSLLVVRKQANEQTKSQLTFPLSWLLDRQKFDTIIYKGYQTKYKKSEVSGLSRLFYDRNSPLTTRVKWYNIYTPKISVEKPIAYIIPQCWQKVIELLKLNQVKMKRLKEDTEIGLNMYYIDNYQTVPMPYEGHYLHTNVILSQAKQTVKFYKGDYVVYVNQTKNRYIVETLEPQGIDSFFAWNFFDSILERKEYFSAYLFEVDAGRLLNQNPDLREQLKQEITRNPYLAESALEQLDWVYRHSEYAEKTYLRYPIGRLQVDTELALY